MRLSSAATALLLWITALASVRALPDGFEDKAVILEGRGLLVPTDFTFTPGGQLLVTNKGGEVFVFDDPDGDNSYSVQTQALDLSPRMCINGERGLTGIEVHPDFESNRFIYIYYNINKNGNCDEDPVNGPINRLSRFVLSTSNIVDIDSETIFFETPSLAYDHHNSGNIAFGNDGHLYVSIGDGGATWSAVSADPGNILGSIVRLTEDGGIPEDNPYTPQSGEANSVRCNVKGVPPLGSPQGAKCQEIFHLGLRNPFRFAMDPNVLDKVRFYINEVGQGLWEEINEGGTDFKGANYGWPAREGPCSNNRKTGCADVHSYTDPIHYYEHVDNGGAVTGGAFVPTGVWSEEYDGAYLYADFAFGKIYLMKESGTPECRTCDPPISSKEVSEITEHIQIVNLGFGPYGNTQALYFSTVFEIRRITYVGDGNRSPYAIILAEPTSGQVGMEVMFSAAGSTDPDGDGLSFEWDFNGDGVVDSTLPNPTYAYNAAGLYYAALTVIDGQGGSHTVSIEISVGNKPIPVIVSPVANTTFAVGDIMTLTGMATDIENGELTDMSLTWEVRQHHGTHYHPFLSLVTGNDIVLQPAPEPEDYLAANISYLEIILTATDADGLSDTVTLDVLPRLVSVDFDTEPSGLEIFLDGTSLTTPATATTWENHNLRLNAPDQFVNGQGYVWSAWSDGEAQSHTISIPAASETAPKFVARFDDFYGTFAPTESLNSGPVCTPGSLGIVAWKSDLVQGDVFINTEFGTYIEQKNDGNLVVRKGTPDDPGELVWESGYSGDVGNYFTRVLGNSNMLTYQGTPPATVDEGVSAPVVWQTGTLDVDWDGNYFFGIDCTGTVVAVFQGYPENAMNVVWQSAPFPGTAATSTMAPSTGTGSPPTTNSSSVRTPGSLGIVAWVSELTQGAVFNNTEFGVYTEQQDDGNLVVWRGTPDDQGELVWESGFSGEVGNYFTRVHANSNMITFKGTPPEDIEAEVWQTGTEESMDPDGLYFFGIDGTGTFVAVYAGTPDNAGAAVWQSAVLAGSPTKAPTVVGSTFAPSTMVAQSAPFAPTSTSSPSASTSISGTSVPTISPQMPPSTSSTVSPSTSVSTPAPLSLPVSVESSLSSSVTLNTFIGMLLTLSLLQWLLI